MRSAPTTDRATWCPTPAARSAASRLRVEVSKNASTAASSHDGEFVTSTTTFAPASAWASPSPVRLLTPEEGEADTASWPRSRGISFLPMSPLPPITTIFMPGLLECRQTGPVLTFPSLFLLFGDDDVLGVLRVQDDGDEARLVLVAGIPADAVQAAGRLVEGVTGLEDLGLVVVDGPLVLALQDVPEGRAGVAVRRLHLARRQRHLDHRGLRLLPVQLLDDVPLGEQLDLNPAFAVSAVLRQGHPADRESTEDNRQQAASHDFSSDRTRACSSFRNKDAGAILCWSGGVFLGFATRASDRGREYGQAYSIPRARLTSPTLPGRGGWTTNSIKRAVGRLVLRVSLSMDEAPTTVIIQRYLDALPGDAAELMVRELLERAVGRLRLLCAMFLYKSYPRLTRPPVNLETDELLGGVVAGLLTALRATCPPTVRGFFALATQHMRWQLNDLARRLEERPAAAALTEAGVAAPPASTA